VWRTAFGLGVILIFFIIYWRVFKLRENPTWQHWSAGRQDQLRAMGILFQQYWHRQYSLLVCWLDSVKQEA
jgi:hypothetical protein